MKKVLLISALLMLALVSFAQTQPDIAYRRSSLNVVFVDDFSNLSTSERRAINEIITSFELPNKYNDHSIDTRLIDLSSITVSKAETKPYERSIAGRLFNHIASNVKATFGVIDDSANDADFIAKYNKYCKINHLAGHSIAKWFNMSSQKVDGSYFNMNLIQDRGAYNASEIDKLRSKESVRGEAILKDAGMELIPSTFTVLIRLHYMTMAEWDIMMAERYENIADSNEKRAAKAQGEQKSSYLQNAMSYREDASRLRNNARTDKGYFISTTSYLYELNWTEDDVEEFFAKYYDSDNPSEIINNENYHFNYIGKSNVQCRLLGLSSLDEKVEMVKQATNRSIDKSFAKLQSEYEVFAVKTPIITVEKNIATAFIGTKEGITSESKFEVLELKYNEAKNVYKYVKVGTLSVDKGKVWDNRYAISQVEGIEFVDKEESGSTDIDRTYLKGASNSIYPGLIIRQTK